MHTSYLLKNHDIFDFLDVGLFDFLEAVIFSIPVCHNSADKTNA